VAGPWEAERTVSPEEARALIREQFPALAAERVEPLGHGWDNTAFRVDGATVFRFPRRAVAVPLLEVEARVMPRLAPRLPLAVPEPRWVGQATERFPWPFLGYPALPGSSVERALLEEPPRRRAARVLGRFLAALHAQPVEGLGLPPDTFAKTDMRSRLPDLEERLHSLHRVGLIGEPAPWLRLFAEASLPLPSPGVVPVHGDLYVRHLLVDPRGELCGVIDWGDVHAGDPGIDLAVMYLLLPPAAHGELLAEYGPIDERTRTMARLRATVHAASTAWVSHLSSDAAMLRTALAGLRHVLEG